MIGQTISHYKILEKLGEGGMGVVYRAQDTSLDRTVALKFLPSHLAASEQDKARFIQEAKAASALNHPNVCTIHAIEEHEGQLFIAMEFVDGQTLREKQPTISFKQAIDIGIQIADGLSAAHEKGIVHRDIKPENIMIRKDGIVQIMDFGLAKLRSATSGINRLTKEGSTVGTAGYMSPEQIQGHDVDHRSDIFSLGVLLYELFTAELPFKGVHETALLYEIVNVDPSPMSSVKPDIDPELDRIVLECLQKEPDERYNSVKDIAKDLKRFKRESSRQRTSRTKIDIPTMQRETHKEIAQNQSMIARISKYLWIALTVLFLGTTIIAFFLFQGQEKTPKDVVRSLIALPENHTLPNINGGGHIALSPDGRKLAFVAEDSLGIRNLWVRALNALTATKLTGTEGAAFPFWSPDNKYIAFFAGGKLKKIEATGGPPFSICDMVTSRGGSWGKDGIIIFPVDQMVGISKVSDAGGTPTEITKLDKARNEQTHRWPYFLPDGKHFLYFSRTSAVGSGSELDAIVVASLDGTVNKRLVAGTSNIAYASGHLLYMRENSLMAHPFDIEALELKGDPFPIAEAVQFSPRYSIASFSVSNTGMLIYQTRGSYEAPELAVVDIQGKKTVSLRNMEIFVSAQLSRDTKWIAMDLYHTGARNSDIWIYEIDRGVNTRFTFDPSVEWYPIWSPDASRIVFASNRKGKFNLYEKVSSGASNEQLLLETENDKNPSDWSSDGKYILFHSVDDPKTKTDIWVLPMSGERKPTPFLRTEYSELSATFSPDMKWVAYQSDESGKNEVYVRPFPGANAKWQVSSNGGVSPKWHKNGKEIFYLSAGKLMSVEVDGAGSTFRIGRSREYFDQSRVGGITTRDISLDGQKILLEISNVKQESVPLTLVLNWDEELEKK